MTASTTFSVNVDDISSVFFRAAVSSALQNDVAWFKLGSAWLARPLSKLETQLVFHRPSNEPKPGYWDARLDAVITALPEYYGSPFEKAFYGLRGNTYEAAGFRYSSAGWGKNFHLQEDGVMDLPAGPTGIDVSLGRATRIRDHYDSVFLNYGGRFPKTEADGLILISHMLPVFARVVEIAVNGLYIDASMRPSGALTLVPKLTQKQLRTFRVQTSSS